MRLFDIVWNKAVFKYKKVKYGNKLRLNGRVHIHGAKGRISIGDDCIITSDGDYNPTAGSVTHLVAGPKGELIIGNNVGMSNVNITAVSSVKIEDNVILGAGVKIWDTDFHSIIFENRMVSDSEYTKTAPIWIQEGVFVGAETIILKGVTIGEKAVIGAGSVVSKSISPNEIWCGNPAHFIRRIEG